MGRTVLQTVAQKTKASYGRLLYDLRSENGAGPSLTWGAHGAFRGSFIVDIYATYLFTEFDVVRDRPIDCRELADEFNQLQRLNSSTSSLQYTPQSCQIEQFFG